MYGAGFRVEGLGLRVFFIYEGLGFGPQGFEFGAEVLRIMA